MIDGYFNTQPTDTYFVLLMRKSSGSLNLVNVFTFEKWKRTDHILLSATGFSQLRINNYDHMAKGPVKLIKQVKIAHSFLQSVSHQFHVTILSLPM